MQLFACNPLCVYASTLAHSFMQHTIMLTALSASLLLVYNLADLMAYAMLSCGSVLRNCSVAAGRFKSHDTRMHGSPSQSHLPISGPKHTGDPALGHVCALAWHPFSVAYRPSLRSYICSQVAWRS